MKKLMLIMAAAFAMVACQTDINEVGVVGGEVDVTFEVGTPTRAAYSDGTTATVLQYAVYEMNDEGATLLGSLTGSKTINISTKVELQLVTGNEYTVIFWAAAPNAPYTVDFEHKTMTVDYSNVLSNNEELDAFYAAHTFTVKGAQTETIYLKRPFAQLNIGTNDYAAAKSAGYEPKYSYVEVSNIYNTLNLWNGAVSNDEKVTYKYTNIPAGETFPVAGYEYLAMNYLLVNESETINVEFGYGESSTDAEKTRIVGSVPVQRNHRTNIYGQLLTSDVDINVEIKPAYDEPSYEADALLLAATVGGEVTLTEDVAVNLDVKAGMILNLDGKTLTGSIDVAEGVSLVVNNGTIVNTVKTQSGIVTNGNVTLNNVNITSARHAVRVESGKVVINGGVYKVEGQPSMTQHAINIGDNGTVASVIIKGGTFIGPKGTAADSGSAVNVRSGSDLTIEGGKFTGGKRSTISGSDITIKGGAFDQNPASSHLAAGYKAIEKNGLYYVVADTVDAVATTATELADALANNDEVVLTAGTYAMPAASSFDANTVLTCEEGVVFEGNSKLNINGATIVGATFSNPAGSAVDQTINGTFKGCTFEGSNGLRWCYAGETVVFEECVFSGSVYGVHFDGGANDIIFKNCTLSGFNTLGGEVTNLTFEGCTFVGNGKSGYNGANLWGNTKLINCEFTFDGSTATEWIDCISASKSYEITNCTVNGVAYTADNAATFTKIFSSGNATVKINGVDTQL